MPANKHDNWCKWKPSSRVLSLCERLFGPPGEALSDLEIVAAERALDVCLPPSYRLFLRFYGSDLKPSAELFGLPRARHWRDVVLMNYVGSRRIDPRRVMIAADQLGRTYFLDTWQPDKNGECAILGSEHGFDSRMAVVAGSFADFLGLLVSGLNSQSLVVTECGTEEV
jgi:SMI1/KNR4 family protein SUKH-1